MWVPHGGDELATVVQAGTKTACALLGLSALYQPANRRVRNEWCCRCSYRSAAAHHFRAFAGNPESTMVQQTANCKTKVRCLMTICTARVSYETKLAALASNRGVWVVQVVLAEVRRLMQFVCPLFVRKHVLCAVYFVPPLFSTKTHPKINPLCPFVYLPKP